MAIKKSEPYSSLWASRDELRGGMDASQYKDYMLVMLFVKYVRDKYAGQRYAEIDVSTGASFKDMVSPKGKTDMVTRSTRSLPLLLRRTIYRRQTFLTSMTQTSSVAARRWWIGSPTSSRSSITLP